MSDTALAITAVAAIIFYLVVIPFVVWMFCGKYIRRWWRRGQLNIPEGSMSNQRIGIIKGLLDHWIIIHEDFPGLAWSGSSWVMHFKGVPIDGIQICNFDSREEAEEYIDETFNAFYPPPPTYDL